MNAAPAVDRSEISREAAGDSQDSRRRERAESVDPLVQYGDTQTRLPVTQWAELEEPRCRHCYQGVDELDKENLIEL